MGLLAIPTLAFAAQDDAKDKSADRANSARDAAADSIVLELYYKPSADLQIAVWLEDDKGKHFRDLFITQATGRLGIGNRPGIWNFLSSWRAPYGPRPSVLPVWAHRRDVTYPKVIFHDNDTTDSLGFHERTSSKENYFCRPLTATEQRNILDTMTCPSPQVFQTDKGRFDPGGKTSVYPPRNDLSEFEAKADHADAKRFDRVNDLDSISGATPSGEQLQRIALTLSRAQLAERGITGKMTAWIEVNLERDENDNYKYSRDKDHFVDRRLKDYGVPYLGQPAVSYRVQFDPRKSGVYSTQKYAGYASWKGANGKLLPPDDSISDTPGSGAGRLLDFELEKNQGRFAIKVNAGSSSGSGSGKNGPTDNHDCSENALKPVQDLEARALAFDRVELSFRVPQTKGDNFAVGKVRAHYQHATKAKEFDLGKAVEASSIPPMCGHAGTEGKTGDECMSLTPGGKQKVLVDSLWGNYTYTFAVAYEDRCGKGSSIKKIELTTPKQEYQQLESFCFVATAAYGASWVDKVWALRRFRDDVLRPSTLGNDLIHFYYSYGPALAKIIDSHELLRSEARHLLAPMAKLALHEALRKVKSKGNQGEGQPKESKNRKPDESKAKGAGAQTED